MSTEPKTYESRFVDVVFGSNVTVGKPSNLYGCTIGDNCFVGPFTEIQSDVIVGARTRIQSHTFVCEFVDIGSDCFIAHGVMFINDRFGSGKPAGNDKTKWERTRIGSRVCIGSGATILPVDICAGAVIGAGAVVTKNITEPGFYAGNPARFLRALSATAAIQSP